jgi:hypothetical protein
MIRTFLNFFLFLFKLRSAIADWNDQLFAVLSNATIREQLTELLRVTKDVTDYCELAVRIMLPFPSSLSLSLSLFLSLFLSLSFSHSFILFLRSL